MAEHHRGTFEENWGAPRSAFLELHLIPKKCVPCFLGRDSAEGGAASWGGSLRRAVGAGSLPRPPAHCLSSDPGLRALW